jgi:hypothetical protein
MSHVRQQIRVALAAKVTGLATTSSNVFQNRTQMVTDANLPCLIIASESDEAQSISLSYPRLTARIANFSIRVLAKATADLDNVLDGICLNVEKALASDTSLGGLTKDLQLMNTSIAFNSDNETHYGEAAMNWSATYYIQETAPDTAL